VSYSKYSGVVCLLVFLAAVLTAQKIQNYPVPLKNWAAPLYWQPNQVERETAVRAAPQLQLSPNAVSTDALTFVAITPCRLVDTRGPLAGFNGIAPFLGPSIPASGTITIPVQSVTEASANTTPAPCGVIPSIAQAYSFNLTVVPRAGGAVDYVSLWPAGLAQPFVSTLNDPQGAVVANAVIVPAGTPTGGISVYNDGPSIADVVIDMNGYFAAPTDLNDNTAIGFGALANNSTGSYNTAAGLYALASNIGGEANTAVGFGALGSNTSGDANTAIGYKSGIYVTTGGNNIHVGSQGVDGDSGVIRIGTAGAQTSAFIAGIYGGIPSSPNLLVCVDASGTLGTTGCSGTSQAAPMLLNEVRKQAEEIRLLEDRLAALEGLRPTTLPPAR
jgi:hypothetical protein